MDSKKKRTFRSLAIMLCLGIVAVSGVSFAIWQYGNITYDNQIGSSDFKPSGGELVEVDTSFEYFGMSQSETAGENLSYYSHTTYTYSYDSNGNIDTTVDPTETTDYAFTSNTLSVVMDLDQTSERFKDLGYDNSVFYSVSIDFKVINYDSSFVGSSLTDEGSSVTYSPNSDDPTNLLVYFYDSSKNVITSGFSSGSTYYVRVFPDGIEGDRSIKARPKVYSNGSECTIVSPLVGGGSDSYWYSFTKDSLNTAVSIQWPNDLTSSYIACLDSEAPGTIRPYNLPNYEFDLEKSANYENKWYFAMKSSQDMSLYSLFTYDHSYEAATDTTNRKVPVEFCFNFDETKAGDVVSLINNNPNSYYYLSFTIISKTTKESMEA